MDFSKIQAILQIIGGVAAMLAQIFSNAANNQPAHQDIVPHVETIHIAATQLSQSLPDRKEA